MTKIVRKHGLERLKISFVKLNIYRSITYSKESVKGAVLHVLSDDHDGVALSHNTLQEDHIGVFELAHDRSLREEVVTSLVG